MEKKTSKAENLSAKLDSVIEKSNAKTKLLKKILSHLNKEQGDINSLADDGNNNQTREASNTKHNKKTAK